MALVLVPEPPIQEWIAQLDAQRERSASVFAGKPVVIDLSRVATRDQGAATLLDDLRGRGVQLVGTEGVHPSWLADGTALPPLLSGGRPIGLTETREPPPAAVPPPRAATSLLIDRPVRSGQRIDFPQGDVTVVGSVASGAEIVAGGTIHVYGPLRGRAIAGFASNPEARIFCTRLEAELIAIDGLYRTADDMASDLRGRAVQAWLQGEAMQIAVLE